eukprot:2405167-Heterocapsa_arctica.AAC.1
MDTFILAASISKTLSRILRPDMNPFCRSDIIFPIIGSIRSRYAQQKRRLSVFTNERGLVVEGV